VEVDAELDLQDKGIFFSRGVSFSMLDDFGSGWRRLVGAGGAGCHWCPS
jgi:hypothetical protein